MTTMANTKVYRDAASLARAGAEQFVALVANAISVRDRFSVALSGGSTPKAMFMLLAGDEFARRVEWSKVHLFWGDERCVPPDHADSNYRMTQETLLSHVPIPESNVYRIRGEIEPAQAAKEYEQVLHTFFGSKDNFDLIFLGMGDDGHTASLFPDTAAIHERQHWVIAHYVEKVSMWRVTFTSVIINAARNVTFLVSGSGKAERLNEVLNGPYQPDRLPSQIIKPDTGQLLWLLDTDAAALL